MSDLPLHSVSVAGVTLDEAGRVLLIKRRDSGEWQPPGGVLELGETFEQGVVREVYEETGVLVETMCLTGVYKNMSMGVVALVYRCRPTGGTIQSSEESAESRWIDLGDALQRMSPAFAIRVSDAAEPQPSYARSRSHDGRHLI